ncbi:MAG: glutamine-hydrolyzing carbamoyl-phosphate synthase small subunit [Deltaproteobacteria bacterium]|nr:glutamine-hydrolyzing carbamoyl-phosphate synthase small subunit [Deltaproteobacteria bacterium]
MTTNNTAWLVLEDGTAFAGTAFGATATAEGEVVFNTSMSGYPELLTDPSYKRQLLTLTVPEVGNYGVCDRDFESDGPQAAGLIVRHLSERVSNWRSDRDLSSWMKDAGIPGIAGIDTRALVLKLREGGTKVGLLSTDGTPLSTLRARAAALPGMAGCELISVVTCKAPYEFTEGLVDDAGRPLPGAPKRFHVVAYDFGMKKNMARLLVHKGCKVTVVPAATTAAEVKALHPDGVLLSNGPGDPSTVPHIVDAVRTLLGDVPIFGICMGHQLLGQALGSSTYKTPFGHRGGNQPVLTDAVVNKQGERSRVLITSQNHGFAVKPEHLPLPARANETNLSDGTNEGVDARARWAFSVQYHPEAAPGPHDAELHFDRFVAMMQEHQETTRR